MTTGFIIGAGGGLGEGSGLEVCDIGMALYVDETKGLRRYLNGQIVDINTNTQAFLNRLKEITTLHPSLLCTENEWQTAKTNSAFGQVGKFVFNYSGENIISVRIPRVVNIQGVFDLQNLGMTVAESLPSHTHTENWVFETGVRPLSPIYNATNTTGSVKSLKTSLSNVSYEEGGELQTGVPSTSTYQDNAHVQPEVIQYPYFIQIATGSETENNIINDIELNNPFSLFDSKYSDHELNNLSWLKSAGQWNAKSAYTDAYDKLLKVYNGTETVVGLSVKLSTETYTDYDFVLNTADETFRLPLLDGSEDLPSDDFTEVLSNWVNGASYTAPTNGILKVSKTGGANSKFFNISINGIVVKNRIASLASDTEIESLFVKKDDIIVLNTSMTGAGNVSFAPAKGNGSLYYYVGETVQNANLINAGRIGEQLANKADKTEVEPLKKSYIIGTYQNGTSWYRIYSDGWCEQGGVILSKIKTNIKINLLKKYANTSYDIFTNQQKYNELDGAGDTIGAYPVSGSQINIWHAWYGGNCTTNVFWITHGYLEKGEY